MFEVTKGLFQGNWMDAKKVFDEDITILYLGQDMPEPLEKYDSDKCIVIHHPLKDDWNPWVRFNSAIGLAKHLSNIKDIAITCGTGTSQSVVISSVMASLTFPDGDSHRIISYKNIVQEMTKDSDPPQKSLYKQGLLYLARPSLEKIVKIMSMAGIKRAGESSGIAMFELYDSDDSLIVARLHGGELTA